MAASDHKPTSAFLEQQNHECYRNAGVQVMKHFVGSNLVTRVQFLNDLDPFSHGVASPEPLDPPVFTFNIEIPLIAQIPSLIRMLRAPHNISDATLQLYKDGDFGNYLETEATLNEQLEEFDNFGDNPRNALILRTQLSVRVHLILEKLINSNGKELSRALFSLKQIFQDDKDLVHGFVENNGLECLIKIGSEMDQNYQNYILRALGQVMIYVDGMNGIMEHNETVQWLYMLIASKFRLVVKTAIKLLLVFVEYTETNCLRLVQGIRNVDVERGVTPWFNIVGLLADGDCSDWELLTFAMKLVNNTIQEIIDRDLFCAQVKHLNTLGMDELVKSFLTLNDLNPGLMQQLTMYQTRIKRRNVYSVEDSSEVDDEEPQAVNSFVADWATNALSDTLESFLCVSASLQDKTDSSEESRKNSVDIVPLAPITKTRTSVHFPDDLIIGNDLKKSVTHIDNRSKTRSSSSSSSSSSSASSGDTSSSGSESDDSSVKDELSVVAEQKLENIEDNIVSTKFSVAGVERVATKPIYFAKEEEKACVSVDTSAADVVEGKLLVTTAPKRKSLLFESPEEQKPVLLFRGRSSRNLVPGSISKSSGNVLKLLEKQLHPLVPAGVESPPKRPPSGHKLMTCSTFSPHALARGESCSMRKSWLLGMMFSKDSSKGSTGAGEEGEERGSADELQVASNRDLTEDLSGVVSRAKESLNRCKSRPELIKSVTTCDLPTDGSQQDQPFISPLLRNKSADLQWDLLAQSLDRPLKLCDLDFTDLATDGDSDSEKNGEKERADLDGESKTNMIDRNNIKDIRSTGLEKLPPAPPPPPSSCGVVLARQPPPPPPPLSSIPKSKKTVKLFWQEIREDAQKHTSKQKSESLWDEVPPVAVDGAWLEFLFEKRAGQDVLGKQKQQMDAKLCKELVVLNAKRSNAINIALTKLPPPRTIRAGILKMDATIVSKDGIEKILQLLPTEEERQKITEAQMMQPDVPLGPAEQFLLTLASISEVEARLRLWAYSGFTKGGQVPEVKDTVHKHTLLYHVCQMMVDSFPGSSDLYSELGPLTRASKVDFDELALCLARLRADCRSSWNHLKAVAKHDTPPALKAKLSEFLADSAERIVLLDIVHRRVMRRYHDFVAWLGVSPGDLQNQSVDGRHVNHMCKVISEFALEYRTTRERVLLQMEKKRLYKQRNRTRGKMITTTAPSPEPNQEQKRFRRRRVGGPGPGTNDKDEVLHDQELRQVLRAAEASATACRTNRRRPPRSRCNAGAGEAAAAATATTSNGRASCALKQLLSETPSSNHSAGRRPPVERRTLRHGLTDAQRKSLGLIA
ncbi:unnamed protein product [Notodromas monacha]|uniref:GBD/FH3 domain-containing protein n=1 Tax=Notodromas monacha TaxID=399045 RepID=A0A7R9BF37_9CRUS|nr:unnamed protein product [Notodromas monacha]CAG0914218.1 unnamed protein product [Notodromas monacha]